MLKLCVAGWNSTEAETVHTRLRSRPDLWVSDVRSTGAEVVETIRTTNTDAVLLPTDWIDVARVFKSLVFPALSAPPSLVLITHSPRLATRARALSCGFDGAVDLSSGLDDLVMDITRITNSAFGLGDDHDLKALGIIPGLLARDLVLQDANDASLADFLATGATDDAIAGAMGWTIQVLRNRIAALLDANGMTHRTQLAVARASSARIPDFVRPLAE